MLAKRDLGVILLALLGVYFSLQNEGVVSFTARGTSRVTRWVRTTSTLIRYRTAPRTRTPRGPCSST